MELSDPAGETSRIASLSDRAGEASRIATLLDDALDRAGDGLRTPDLAGEASLIATTLAEKESFCFSQA